MPRHDFLFVDESGDPGFALDPQTGGLLSSSYYVSAVLHLCDDSFGGINKHVAAFRHFSGSNRELKIPPEREEYARFLSSIRMMSEAGKNIWASAVYLNKHDYNGAYLKPGGTRPANPTMFRNYVLRRLLEHHFDHYSLKSSQYDLVLGRIDLSAEQNMALMRYLSGNKNIPTPTHLTHASSIYVEGLQIVHHIANGYKDLAMDGHRVPQDLSLVRARNITTNQYNLRE